MDPQRVDLELEGLRNLVGVLWKQVDRSMAMAETLRALLIEQGVLTAREVDAKLRDAERTQTLAMLEMFKKALGDYESEAMRQLLEKIKPQGPTH